MVLWITGISGAGKTTVADAIRDILKPSFPQLVRLDGDEIREVFGKSLGYSAEDRSIQIQRIQRLALVLSRQQIIVIVAALYSHPSLLEWNSKNLPNYFEVHLDASLDLVKNRDSKGLYGQAEQMEIPNIVGLDIPRYDPVSPDLHINADNVPPVAELANKIIEAVPWLDVRAKAKQ
jgi:adenylylsulfate kinase